MDKPWISKLQKGKCVHAVVKHKAASTFATVALVAISEDIIVLLLRNRSPEDLSWLQPFWKLTRKTTKRWLKTASVVCVSICVRYQCYSCGLRQCAANWWASDHFTDRDCVFIRSPAAHWKSNTCDSDGVCAVLYPYIRGSRGRSGVSSLG